MRLTNYHGTVHFDGNDRGQIQSGRWEVLGTYTPLKRADVYPGRLAGVLVAPADPGSGNRIAVISWRDYTAWLARVYRRGDAAAIAEAIVADALLTDLLEAEGWAPSYPGSGNWRRPGRIGGAYATVDAARIALAEADEGRRLLPDDDGWPL